MVDSHGEVSAMPQVNRGPEAGLRIQERGVFTFTVRDADGNVTQTAESHNALTTVGANQILDNWRTTTGATSLYIGLINGNSSVTLNASDTMASHSGWTEEDWAATTDYIRQLWNPSGAAAGALTASSATFNLAGLSSSTQTIAGAFLVDNDGSSSATAGVLYATSTFTANSTLTLGINDTLTISFSITLS